MNYLNTKKEKFCGKSCFTSRSMTEEEFLRYLNQFLEMNDGDKIDDLSWDSIDYAHGIIMEVFEEKTDIFNGAVLYLNEYVEDERQFRFHRLDNGFCYIGLYTNTDEVIAPIYNILYFDEYGDLCSYVPYYGNLINPLAEESAFCCNGNDSESYKYLTEKYREQLIALFGEKDTKRYINENVTCGMINLLCLGWEYGTTISEEEVKICINKGTTSISKLIHSFDVNDAFVLEDIKSNVVL